MKIALVTTTLSKDPSADIRASLAIKTCQAAQAAGYQIYIVDGSPDSVMKRLLEADGAIVEIEKVRGMGASRRQCFWMGLNSDADVIVWLEPEKYPFVPFIRECAHTLEAGGYDIVFPGRQNLDGYPCYQHLSELRTNRRLGVLTSRPDIDWMFGPRVFSRNGAKLIVSYDGCLGDQWQSIFIPVLRLLKSDPSKVSTRLVNYVHPPEQTAAEEGDEVMDRKRDEQRMVLETAFETECKRLDIKGLS